MAAGGPAAVHKDDPCCTSRGSCSRNVRTGSFRQVDLVWMILIDFHGLRRYVSHRFFFTTPRDAAFSRGTPRSTLVFFSLHVLLLLWCSSELPPDWPASPVYLPSLYLAKKLGKRILFPMHLSILFLSHLSPSFFLLEDVFQNMSLSHLSQSNLSR